MNDIHLFNYPSDFANFLQQVWDKKIGGQYSPPPLPSNSQFQSFLETTYHASLETDEARPLQFTVCATPESLDVSQFEVWPFTSDRQFNIQEIRRLAFAANLDSSALWVRFPADEQEPLVIHGLINFGSSWAHARKAYQYHYDKIPNALLLRAEGPGKLIVYQGQYRMAALIGGEIVEAVSISKVDLYGIGQLFFEAQTLLRDEVTSPIFENEAEWKMFEWNTIINVILSVVNTVKMKGHGGALLFLNQSCDLDDVLRIKYKLSNDANGLRNRLVHFLNLRHKYGDMIFPPQFKQGTPVIPEETKSLKLYELAEAHRKLIETCTCIGNFAGIDGAIVIGTDFKLKGFGAEIRLDTPTSSKVYVVKDQRPLDAIKEEGDSESFGMRHRSAMRLCGTKTGLAVFVVSQDGGVSLVFNGEGRCYYKSGIQTANANMFLA